MTEGVCGEGVEGEEGAEGCGCGGCAEGVEGAREGVWRVRSVRSVRRMRRVRRVRVWVHGTFRPKCRRQARQVETANHPPFLNLSCYRCCRFVFLTARNSYPTSDGCFKRPLVIPFDLKNMQYPTLVLKWPARLAAIPPPPRGARAMLRANAPAGPREGAARVTRPQ